MKEVHMSRKLMGKKRGMVQLFDDNGHVVVCTVIEAEPNIITQIKTKEKDGYDAIQLGFEKIRVKDQRTIAKRVKKPQIGHFAKAGVEPCRHLAECKVENTTEYSVGQELTVTMFADDEYIDATAISIGKGYQGVMKLHNFGGGPAAHGSGFHRHAGSTGMRSTPGRCFPGGKRASHMGAKKVTVQSLRVVMINEEENLILVEGKIPGPKNGLVTLTNAMKKKRKKKKKS